MLEVNTLSFGLLLELSKQFDTQLANTHRNVAMGNTAERKRDAPTIRLTIFLRILGLVQHFISEICRDMRPNKTPKIPRQVYRQQKYGSIDSTTSSSIRAASIVVSCVKIRPPKSRK